MNDASRFVEGLDYQSFLADSKTVYAVTRALEIVGEASTARPRQNIFDNKTDLLTTYCLIIE